MGQDEIEKRGKVVYFSHGGGPLPILGDESHQAMLCFMEQLPTRFPRPEAVVVISAHWEEQTATLLANPAPPMFYDYYGFPSQAYEIDYPASGNPLLAERVVSMIRKAGLSADMDSERGFDHGLFIPMKMMYPEADIPVIQLSLIKGLDPGMHIELGKSLQPLLNENILIIGSGFSFHNLRAFKWNGEVEPDSRNDEFQDWLIQTCASGITIGERENQLKAWEKAPHARYCHPREEHLLPLHVCCGLTGQPASVVFDDTIMGKRAVAFLW